MKKKAEDKRTEYQKELSEAQRQKKRDKVRRTLIFGIFGLCACVAVLLLLISSIAAKFMKITYPESTLSAVCQSELETTAYEDLTTVVRFGEFYMCIPTADVVSASEEMVIMKDSTHTYAITKKDLTEESTLNADLPFLINTIGASSYTAEVMDSGYINTIRATYIAGSAKSNGNLYFVSYELFSLTEKMEILITAKNQGNLNLAKDTLDRIVGTAIYSDEYLNLIDEIDGYTQKGANEENSDVVPADDAPHEFTNDGERGKFAYDDSYPQLVMGRSVDVKEAYDEKEGAILYRVENVTSDVKSGDRVYYEVTLYFPVDDAENTYFGTDKGDCYLVDLSGYMVKPSQVDKEFSRSLTYVFECPNERLGAINNYALVIEDPLRKVERAYFVVNDVRTSQYSPDYEPQVILHDEETP